jgi:hypothetical protein
MVNLLLRPVAPKMQWLTCIASLLPTYAALCLADWGTEMLAGLITMCPLFTGNFTRASTLLPGAAFTMASPPGSFWLTWAPRTQEPLAFTLLVNGAAAAPVLLTARGILPAMVNSSAGYQVTPESRSRNRLGCPFVSTHSLFLTCRPAVAVKLAFESCLGDCIVTRPGVLLWFRSCRSRCSLRGTTAHNCIAAFHTAASGRVHHL